MDNRNTGPIAYYEPSPTSVEGMPNTLYVGHEPPRPMLQPHWHAQGEVNYMVRGTMDYRMGSSVFRLSADDLILFWGGMAHQTLAVSDDADFVCIHLPLTDFFRLLLTSEIQNVLIHGGSLITSGTDPCDRTNFVRWSEYLRFGTEDMVENALDEVLLRLERIQFGAHRLIASDQLPSIPVVEMENVARMHVTRISMYIGENFRQEIAASDIARAVDLHPKYAMKLFKGSTGMTINQYVTLLRLSYAQALLTKQPTSVVDIAMDSGFGSLSAFNKSFAKLAGRSPTDYRRHSGSRINPVGVRQRIASNR